MDRVVVLRAGLLYIPLCLTAIAWLLSSPGPRDRAAALLATAWNISALLGLHVAAVHFGWWSYGVSDATLAGFPVDFYVGWAVAWGALPVLVGRRIPVPAIVFVALGLDLVAMPRLEPVLHLGLTWLVGEAVAIAVCLIPAQLLGAWTRRDTHLPSRATLQAIAFGALALGVLPEIILSQSGGSWAKLVGRPGWATGLLLQLVAFAGLLGVSALQEFATRGGGTPVPFDPPKRIVTSGPYAYVRNPMQLSAALVMIIWGAMLGSWWVMAAGVMAVVYGSGFAAWDERADLERRFGASWRLYASEVRSWMPRWRPVDVDDLVPDTLGTSRDTDRSRRATLYVAEECGPCSEVRSWFDARSPVGLQIVAAERHPTRSLTRITYDPSDGSAESVGVAALGRALEHVHLGWAMTGMFMRLPVIAAFLQLVTDASGGGRRDVRRYCERPDQARYQASARI